MAIGWWRGKSTFGNLLAIWGLSWLGNLLGAVLLAVLLLYSTVLNPTSGAAPQNPGYLLLQELAAKKMSLAPLALFTRGILCNWLVCLAVWCTYRMQSESGKLIMIFWCLYAFVAAGFEHSVANMTLFSLALLQPHTAAVSWGGMGYNLLWVSLGNALGGALLVGGAYWAGAHRARREPRLAPTVSAATK